MDSFNFGAGVLPEEIESNGIKLSDNDINKLTELANDSEIVTTEKEEYVKGEGDVYIDDERKKFKKEKNDKMYLEPQEFEEDPIKIVQNIIHKVDEKLNSDILDGGDEEISENVEEDINFEDAVKIATTETDKNIFNEDSSKSRSINSMKSNVKYLTEYKFSRLFTNHLKEFKLEVRGFMRDMKSVMLDVAKIHEFYANDKKKIEEAIAGMKKYSEELRENERMKKQLEGDVKINLSYFTDDEKNALRNSFNENMQSYEYMLRNTGLLSDNVLDKAKVIRLARRVIMSTMSIIEPTSRTYKKLDKLILGCKDYGQEIDVLYQRYEIEELNQDIILQKIGKVLRDNEEDINRIIDVYSSITNKKDMLNFDPIAGINIGKREAFELYEEVVNNF